MSVCNTVDTWFFVFFFFSSRRRHTRLQGDWSSDVCSSDLVAPVAFDASGRIYVADSGNGRLVRMDDMNGTNWTTLTQSPVINGYIYSLQSPRSEERRVGKECRSRWSPYH